MNYIWTIIVIAALIAGMFSGDPAAVVEGAFKGADSAVKFILSTGGIICLWSGLLKIADECGVSAVLGKLLSPLTRRIFPRIPKDSPAMKNITMNMTANLLGTGNAATPAGIRAMSELERLSSGRGCSREMCIFAVINTASLQLIPSTVISIRAAAGSADPSRIIPAVWAVSAAAFAAAVISACLFAKRQ